jgi:two-component system, cell cycle sensor histidine kinase and response regulator CckA
MEAGDGHEAIALLEQHASHIRLVITDMVMPDVNGLTLLKSIQARWPKLPVIMVSAYLSAESGQKILGNRVAVLPKPIRPSALVASVGSVVPRPD